jgi:hypothetical protein
MEQDFQIKRQVVEAANERGPIHPDELVRTFSNESSEEIRNCICELINEGKLRVTWDGYILAPK